MRRQGRLRQTALSFGGVVALSAIATGMAQLPRQTVQWTAAVHSGDSLRGGSVTLELSGRLAEGWHVYAQTQAPGGPTPLRIALDANDFAQIAGAPSGSVPEHKFDPSFGLETQFYSGAFTLLLPVRVARPSAAGRRSIPVSVRFQTCNGRECEPPRTIHLSVTIDAGPEV